MRLFPKISKTWFFLAGLLFVRGVWATHYFIPSESMLPNLEVGDFVLTHKRAYSEPSHFKRGDVVIFEYPKDPSVLFVKRLIGLPGDEIEYVDGQLSINGISASYSEVSQGETKILVQECWQTHCRRIQHNPHTRRDHFRVRVPEGHYFMMGDNRDNSSDSRFWGAVPHTHIVGQGTRVLWNLSFAKLIPTGDLSRVGLKL